jgi:hypothetical protein
MTRWRQCQFPVEGARKRLRACGAPARVYLVRWLAGQCGRNSC